MQCEKHPKRMILFTDDIDIPTEKAYCGQCIRELEAIIEDLRGQLNSEG